MKKLVLMFVAIAAILFASCGNKTEKAAGTDSLSNDTTAQVDTTSADTTATDSVK